MKTHLSIILILFASLSCKRDDEIPQQELKLVWETVISDDVNFGSLQPTPAGDLVLYGRGVDLSQDNQTLLALDKRTGQKIWEWSDGIANLSPTLMPGKSQTVVDNGYFYFQSGGKTFSVDLGNGSTHWKTISPNDLTCRSCDLNIVDNHLFWIGTNSIDKKRLLKGDLATGNFDIIFTLSNDQFELGAEVFLSNPVGYTLSDGRRILIYANPVAYINTNRGMEPYLVGYNPETKEEVYRVLLDERAVSNTVDGLPLLYDNKVYLATNRMIKCHNPENGEEIWGQRFDGNFLFAGFTIGDGVVYGTHDNDYHTVAMDAETGRVLWRRKIAGTTSPIQYHNGILYFVGGNTGLLHVIDAQTGNEIAALQAPSQLRGDPDDYFSRDMRIDPQSGMLFAKSLHHAYAYKLYR